MASSFGESIKNCVNELLEGGVSVAREQQGQPSANSMNDDDGRSR